MLNKTPYLLTPGPLTTSTTTKQAMLKDWGSWDEEFNEVTKSICQRLLAMVEDQGAYVCVPMQGSGTFAVESALGTLLPQVGGKTLVIANGAYGQRIAKIISYLRRPYCLLDKGDFLPPLPEEVDTKLRADASISDVVIVHCETSSGILNPIAEIGAVVKHHGKRYIIDAMSSLGALPLSTRTIDFAACISSANKCIEGVPGFGFVIVKEQLLRERRGNAHSLSLDLWDQWQGFLHSGKWRFTPPTHVVAAFDAALQQHAAEGGVAGRYARYHQNHRVLLAGMKELGFETLIPEDWLSPIITTFLSPADKNFSFKPFYESMKAKGFIIYPGKLTEVESFRLGNIGAIDASVMQHCVRAIDQTLREMGVRSTAPLPCLQRNEVPPRCSVK